MKDRLSHSTHLPSLFNLGLHQLKKTALPSRENDSYQRKIETLENPIRKSVELSELITLFWTFYESGAQIAIINNADQNAFSYELWFEGTEIRCYEGSWVPGLWSNSLLKNPTPDLVILLSTNALERSAILGAVRSLNVPVINFSSDDSDGNQLPWEIQGEQQRTHFFMEIIRSISLRFERKRNLATESGNKKKDLSTQLRRIRNHFIKQVSKRFTPFSRKKLWSSRKRRAWKKSKKQYIQKNLIFLKSGNRVTWNIWKSLKSRFSPLPIKSLRKASPSKKKWGVKKRTSLHLSSGPGKLLSQKREEPIHFPLQKAKGSPGPQDHGKGAYKKGYAPQKKSSTSTFRASQTGKKSTKKK